MAWPFSTLTLKRTAREYPVSETIKRAADASGMEVDPMTSGFLSQAQIIEEIAKRLVALERSLVK